MLHILKRRREAIAKPPRRRWVAALVMFCVLLAGGAVARGEATFHVAPDGDDAGAGTRAAPLATVHRAQRAVRAHLKENPGEAVTVVIHPGTYRLAEPLVFTPADSGTKDAPVTYRGGEGGRPVLSGGMRITGWRKDGEVWRTTVDPVKRGDLFFHQLFVNGRRATPARAPNRFYLRTAGPVRPLGDRRKARRDPSTKQGFRFREGDIREWRNPDDVYIELYHSWTTSLHWIESLDAERRIVRFTNRTGWPVGYWETFERYRVHHCFEALDAPGEWYLDRGTGTLTYRPREGETTATAEVVAPRLADLVRFEGKPAEGRFVAHVRLEGLSFQHEDWDYERTETIDGQAHAKRQNAAITAFGLRHGAIERCEVAHVGGHAIRLDAGCQNVRIVQCEIHDCGGGGVYVGPDAKVGYMPPTDALKVQRNTIENNFIHHTSYVLGGSIGVWVGSASLNRIRHNEISDFDYTGISVGWSWNRKRDIFQHGNVIEFNHVHHNVGDILSDNGGIYVLGYSPGSVIRGNVVHHIRHYPYINDSRAIYLDGAVSDYLVERNLSHHIDSFGLMMKGQRNVVRHNIFAFCGDSGLNRLVDASLKDAEYAPSRLEHNIVYQADGAMTSGFHGPQWTRLDHNLYWSTQGREAVRFNDRSSTVRKDAPKVDGASFARWQELGRDAHSIVADPAFVDPAAGDFRLKEGSPAKRTGFKAFDHDEAGLYGDAAWTSRPKAIQREPHVYAPPPPSGLPAEYGFEVYDAGSVPLVKGRLIDGGETGIRVTDEAAAAGKKSLAFTDGPAKQSWLPHWTMQLPRHERGTVALACDLMNDAEAPGRVRLEFRDWSDRPLKAGPIVTVQPNGGVQAGGKTVATVPPGRWFRLEIRFAYGPEAAKTWSLAVRPAAGEATTASALPMASRKFGTCTWFGVSGLSDGKGRFYLDNVTLAVEPE